MRDDDRLADPGDLQPDEASRRVDLAAFERPAMICGGRRTMSFSTREICATESRPVIRSNNRNR
jgi:hypothetical protein